MPPVQPFKQFTVKPKGYSDALDATNAFPGAMSSLSNLMPAPHTPQMWIPRPGSFELTGFTGFTSPTNVEVLLVVGNICYGMIASGLFSGKSQPFAYNLSTNTFQTISGMLTGNLPTSLSTSGDWEPPTCDLIASRIIFTHAGFSLTSNKIGWLDISGFSSTTITGTTNGTTSITGLSTNVLNAGWMPGMTIQGSAGDIPAGATIVSIASNGLSVTISIAATGSHSGQTMTVAGGTATTPQWAAGTTNGFGLVTRPVAVKGFNGRAWYAVGTGRQFSDAGNPTQITNASQALTNSNGLADTAFGGLPVYQSTGGVLQSLIAFQGAAGMVMITGDQSTSNLAVNKIGGAQGCIAPNTIATTNRGLMYAATDGLRLIDLMGNVSEPIGGDGRGVEMAFLQAIYPSRMCAAYNGDVYRISMQNGNALNQPWQEYWYHLAQKVWSGPHTFPSSLIAPWPGSSGNGFVMAPQGITAQLWQGNVTPGLEDSFTENGVSLSWTMTTTLLPDSMQASQNVMVQSTLMCGLESGQTITVTALDEYGNVLNQPTISGMGTGATIWGSFIWGAADWLANQPIVVQRPIYWTAPILFKQVQIEITGNSVQGTLIGNLYSSYKSLGYQTAQQG